MSFKFDDIEDESYKKLAKRPKGKTYIWVTPKKLPANFPLNDQSPLACCLSFRYKNMAETIKNFEVFEDDIWLVTYPRSGTTWCQQQIYLLKNELDYEKALNTKMQDRFPFLELDSIRDMPPEAISHLEKIQSTARPRLIKTHLPMQLLPDQIWTVNPKIVYVYRQTKDVAVSYFHQYKTWDNYQGGMQEFLDCFVGDCLMWSPYHKHISNFLELSEIQKNVHLVKYENLKKDLHHEILRMSKFLETNIRDEQILKLMEHLNIDNMKKNPAVNLEIEMEEIKKSQPESNYEMTFIRKGEVGGWKNELTPEMGQQIDNWSNEKIRNDKFLKKYLQKSSQQ